MITDKQRHMVLVADRTRDLDVIATIIDTLLAENKNLSPLDVEAALRDAAAHAYLIAAASKLSVVIGMPAWKSALAELGVTPDENRAALAAFSKE